MSYDTTFNVRLSQNAQQTAPQANDIAQVNLLRFGAITHGFDQNQRCVPLQFSVYDDHTLAIEAPANGNLAPPGNYLLFLISDAGAPSIAGRVRVAAAP